MILSTHGLLAPPMVNQAETNTFVTAAGLTDAGLIRAVDFLVSSLKGYGPFNTLNKDFWTGHHAIYPFVTDKVTNNTDRLDQMKWNLKNPVDTDAGFRLSYTNAPTASTSGIKGNGSSS